MFAMGIIALGVLAVMAVALFAGFSVWILSLLVLFKILPANPPKILRILSAVYFVCYATIFTFVAYKFAPTAGFISGASSAVLLGAGIIHLMRDQIE